MEALHFLLNYNGKVYVNALIQFICTVHPKTFYVRTLYKCNIFHHETSLRAEDENICVLCM